MSSDAEIEDFTIVGQIGSSVIDSLAATVLVEMPENTDLTNLTATFTVSNDATANPPSPLTTNFSTDVSITVTAENGDPKVWTVSVIEETP